MLSMSRVLVVLLVASALVFQGCGGGGGGGGDDDADASLLTGNYFLCVFGANDGMPDEGLAAWAVCALDGTDTLTGTAGQNIGGSVSGPIPANATYTVAGDRQSTFLFGGSVGYAGWTDASGSIASAGNVSAGQQPAWLTLMKLGSGFADADLQGDWFMLVYGVSLGGSATTYWGSTSLDAMAEGTFTYDANSEGTLLSNMASVAATVAANGQVSLSIGSTNYEGAVHASKNLVVLTGSTTNGEWPYIVVLVRKTSGASAATLSGTYQLVGIERDGGGFASLTGSVVADGMGSVTATFSKNSDGVISNSGPEIVGYTVGADGALVVDPMGEPLEGGLSSGGTFAAFGGPTPAMTNPRLYLLMRR